jgi:hypothetical protein
MLASSIGIAGVILLLGSFILSTAAFLNEKVKESSSRWAPLYSLSNFLGAAMLAYYAYALDNIIFLIVEGTWSVVGLVAVLQNLRIKAWLARIIWRRTAQESSPRV